MEGSADHRLGSGGRRWTRRRRAGGGGGPAGLARDTGWERPAPCCASSGATACNATIELVELDVATGASKVLVSDTKGDWGSIEEQGPVYVKTGGDFIWFSERDGWGHYYLYSYDGHSSGN